MSNRSDASVLEERVELLRQFTQHALRKGQAQLPEQPALAVAQALRTAVRRAVLVKVRVVVLEVSGVAPEESLCGRFTKVEQNSWPTRRAILRPRPKPQDERLRPLAKQKNLLWRPRQTNWNLSIW